jgi:6-pyruvoyltetrahydropterin/6-carboxytetrahydropterin synthase
VESPNNACEIYAADSESTSVNAAVSQPVLAIV